MGEVSSIQISNESIRSLPQEQRLVLAEFVRRLSEGIRVDLPEVAEQLGMSEREVEELFGRGLVRLCQTP